MDRVGARRPRGAGSGAGQPRRVDAGRRGGGAGAFSGDPRHSPAGGGRNRVPGRARRSVGRAGDGSRSVGGRVGGPRQRLRPPLRRRAQPGIVARPRLRGVGRGRRGLGGGEPAPRRGADEDLPAAHGGERRGHLGAPGRDRRAPGPERRGQDHDLLHDRRAHPAQRGAGLPRRRGHHQRPDVQAGAQGRRLPGPGAVDLPQAHRRGERPGDPGDARSSPGARRRRAWSSCSRSSGSRACARARRIRSRAASADGWRSRGPWCSGRSSCSWTSRSPGSTRSR